MKHTPGPWGIGNAYECARDHAIISDGMVIAKVIGQGYPTGLGWAKDSAANAALIAAAPDLLKACLDVEQAQRDGTYEKAFLAVRAAIARANGG